MPPQVVALYLALTKTPVILYILSDHRFVGEKLTEYISCVVAARRPRGRRTGNMMREHRISLGKTNIPRGEIRVKATSFHTMIRCTILREHDKPEVTGYILISSIRRVESFTLAKNSLHLLLSNLGLGKLLYHTFYAPRSVLQKTFSQGLFRTLQSRRGHALMRRQAQRLKPLPQTTQPLHEVCFLTGSQYWHQTCFCAYTLQAHTSLPLQFRLFDDGSLTSHQQDTLRALFPWITIISSQESEETLVEHLPPQLFPSLHARRKEYPHLKKLLDIHCGHNGWRLVLDSDMLFFREPSELLQWLQHPTTPMYMLDCITSYGYSLELLQELAGCQLPERVNVGICGLQSDSIDWEQVEYWCKTMIEREGTHYVQEQALTAMLLGGQECTPLSENTYICCPSQNMVEEAAGSLHHYVAESKSWYYQIGWRKSLERIQVL